MRDIDYAIEILGATNDGNDLTPGELKMVENAANHFLNERGLKALAELHERVVRKACQSPLGPQRLSDDDEGCMCGPCSKRGPDSPALNKPKATS